MRPYIPKRHVISTYIFFILLNLVKANLEIFSLVCYLITNKSANRCTNSCNYYKKGTKQGLYLILNKKNIRQERMFFYDFKRILSIRSCFNSWMWRSWTTCTCFTWCSLFQHHFSFFVLLYA
ncbi:MAG: hypothetical protein ACI89M_002296 [Chitinophagales bacterium]